MQSSQNLKTMSEVGENKSLDLQRQKALILSPPSEMKIVEAEKAEKVTNGKIQNCLEFCSDKVNCMSLNDILRSFNAPLSEEQAWSLIYQLVLLYRNFIHIEFIDKHTKKDAKQKSSHRIKVPKSARNLNIHKDGSVHISDSGEYKARSYSSLVDSIPLDDENVNCEGENRFFLWP
jgi:Kinase non-catalytic C-lobe domain